MFNKSSITHLYIELHSHRTLALSWFFQPRGSLATFVSNCTKPKIKAIRRQRKLSKCYIVQYKITCHTICLQLHRFSTFYWQEDNLNKTAVVLQGNCATPLYISIDTECAGSYFFRLIHLVAVNNFTWTVTVSLHWDTVYMRLKCT